MPRSGIVGSNSKIYLKIFEESLFSIVAVSSVQCNCSVLLGYLWPHGMQHASLPHPLPTPRAHSNSCPWSRWCHPTISSSVVPFSSCLQSFPASWSFPVSQFFASDGQSIGTSALASVLPMNIQDWFPLGRTVLISLQSKGLSRVFSNTTVQNHQFFRAQPKNGPTLTFIHDYWRNHSLDCSDICCLSLPFMLKHMLSRLVITFLPRRKCVLMSWLQSPSAVILEPKKIKSVTVSIFSLSICREVMGPDVVTLVFWMLSFKPGFSLAFFTFIKRLFSSSSFCAIRVVSSAYLSLLIFPQVPIYISTTTYQCSLSSTSLTSVQFSSVAQSYPTLCDPMNRSMLGLSVHHQLPELTQTHVHRVGDAIQPSHPLSSPSPPVPNPSHHQGLFQWVNSLHEVAKVLECQLQHQSFQWAPRADLL